MNLVSQLVKNYWMLARRTGFSNYKKQQFYKTKEENDKNKKAHFPCRTLLTS
jgi:hypothetical protein